MKELATQESTDSLCPQGKTEDIKDIPVYTEGVHIAATLGIVGGVAAPMVFLATGMVDLFDFMQWSHLTIPGSAILGIMLSAGTAGTLTAKNRLRKELMQSKEFAASAGSTLKMLSLKKKNTVLDLGKNADGKARKAIVRSSLKGLTVEYLSMPSPLETWDRTAQTLIEVHGLTTKASSMVRSQP